MHLRYLSLDWNILHTFSFALQKIKFLSLPFWEHIVYYIWYLRCLIVCACITWVISYELLVCVCTLESDFHCFGFIWIKIWSSSVWTFISFCLLYDTRDRRTHVLVLVHARFYRIAQAKYPNDGMEIRSQTWQKPNDNTSHVMKFKKKTATANSMSEQDSEQVNEWVHRHREVFDIFLSRTLLAPLPACLLI